MTNEGNPTSFAARANAIQSAFADLHPEDRVLLIDMVRREYNLDTVPRVGAAALVTVSGPVVQTMHSERQRLGSHPKKSGKALELERRERLAMEGRVLNALKRLKATGDKPATIRAITKEARMGKVHPASIHQAMVRLQLAGRVKVGRNDDGAIYSLVPRKGPAKTSAPVSSKVQPKTGTEG